MTEDQLEQEALGWLADVGYPHLYGPDIAPDGSAPERADYRQVLLPFRLREAIHRLNPDIPTAARKTRSSRCSISASRRCCRPIASSTSCWSAGVPVQYQKDGETRGDFVRLIDWADPAQATSGWRSTSSRSRGRTTRAGPDIILFVNGLPLVLLELKNPADENADIWKAYDQIQTYKEQIPDVFQYNEVLVISDGSEARLGSLSAEQRALHAVAHHRRRHARPARASSTNWKR